MEQPFRRALKFVLEHEGGFSSDPRDPGGVTNFGISSKAYPHLDIRSLTLSAVEDLYRKDYWLAGCCDGLPPPIAFMHLDCCVNMGIVTANTLLQLAAGVDADGRIGPKTLGAVNRANRRALCIEYATRRIMRYAALKQFDIYGLGWVRRTQSCLAHALAAME